MKFRPTGRNLYTLFTGETISSLLAFLVTLWLARRLTEEGFGLWAFVQSAILYLVLLQDLGLSLYGMREIARSRDLTPNLVVNIVAIRLLLGIGLAAVMIALLPLTRMPAELHILFLGGLLWLLPSALNLDFAFQGMERMEGVAFWRILIHLLYLPLILVLVRERSDLVLVPFCRAAAGAGGVVVLYLYFRRFFRLHPLQNLNLNRGMGYLKVSIVMAASAIVIKLFYSFDTFMLGLLDRPAAVGWYQAAYKVVLFFIGLASLIQTAFAPVFARESDNLGRPIYAFSALLLFLGSLCTFSLILVSRPLVRLFYGTAYTPAGPALVLLSLSCLAVFCCTVFLAPLLFGGRQKHYLAAIVLGALVNIVLNLALIPVWSYKGAAVATICSNLTMLLCGALYCRLWIDIKAVLGSIGATLALALGCFAAPILIFDLEWIRGFVFIVLFTTLYIALFQRQRRAVLALFKG